MSGSKIVAMLFGAGLLLTLAFRHGMSLLLGEPIREAAHTAQAFGEIGSLPPPQASTRPPEPQMRRGASQKPAQSQTSRAAPAGWAPDDGDWSAR